MTEQSIVFLFSCVVGGFLGAFYDVFRIIRIAFNSKWLAVFFQDLIFCIFSAISVILLVFYTNSGMIRWFSLLGCFMCFVLYHITIGRIVMFLSKKIIDFIKRVLRFLYKITVIPVKTAILFILGRLRKFICFILKISRRSRARLYYGREKQKVSKSLVRIIKKDSVKSQKAIVKPGKKKI